MAETLHLFCAGVTHHTAGLDQREALSAVPAATLHAWAEERQRAGELAEWVILATCNRIECYGVGRAPSLAEAFSRHLCAAANVPHEIGGTAFRHRPYESAAVHLFEVAASLDSQLVGETEILGQLKDAYAKAGERGTCGAVLHRLFQKAIQSAKWVRSNTAIGRGLVSIGSVAADLAGDIFGDLADASALVIGAGEVGEKTARALASRGLKRLTIVNRGAEAGAALAAALSARHALWADLDRELAGVDIVVSSTAAPMPILTAERILAARPKRRARPLFLIDLAMPRDIDPKAGLLSEVFLYNLDDLAAIAEANRQAREAELASCRTEVQRRALAAWQSVAPRLGGAEEKGSEK